MKCPACKNPLREKSAGDLTLDICYGGCGGMWFDAAELERVSARAATTLHSVWQIPVSHVKLSEPRLCPRCPGQILDRKHFSEAKKVEIDQCPKCAGIWLDPGEFSLIYEEMKGAKVEAPGWARAMAEAVALVNERTAAKKADPGAKPNV
jgi:Zn-finger nucleic acid-binding protein